MPYVITEPCLGVKDRACVEVCTVDCIYEILNQRVITVDIDKTLFCLFDALTKERAMAEIINQLQKELQRKFYLLPIDLVRIKRTLEKWSKTKVF